MKQFITIIILLWSGFVFADETKFFTDVDRFMSRYVEQGRLDYRSINDNQHDLDPLIQVLKTFPVDVLTDAEQMAFWINTYNMLTIYGVLNELRKNPKFAQKGNKSYIRRVNFFYRTKYRIGGKDFSLYQIENDIIRKEFTEPRIHFALNCGSASCPLLKDGLYSAENLDAELEAAATIFIRSPSGAWIEEDKGVIHLSSIFKWYREDFERASGTVLNFVKKYMQDQDRELIEGNPNLEIKYQPYDWGLNIA